MNIIYSCYWGGYLAVVAASLHIGILEDKNFDYKKALTLPMFDKVEEEHLGRLFYFGKDGKGRKVYIVASKKSGDILERVLKGIAYIFGISKTTFIDLNNCSNFYISLGLFLTKRTILKKQGLFLVIKGIKKDFAKIEKIVRNVYAED